MSGYQNWPAPVAQDDAITLSETGTQIRYVTNDNGSGADENPASGTGTLQVLALDGDPAQVGVQRTFAEGVTGRLDANGYLRLDLGETYFGLGEGETATFSFTYRLGNGSLFKSPGSFPAAIVLSDLTAAEGFRIVGQSPKDELGYAVAGFTDPSGDGGALLIGAPQRDAGSFATAGEGYGVGVTPRGVPEGDTLFLGELGGSGGVVSEGGGNADRAGTALASGDVLRADASPDIVAGAPGADVIATDSDGNRVTLVDAGRVYVTSATYWSDFYKNFYYPYMGYKIDGPEAGWEIGSAVSAGRDVNGDGVDDMLIGAAKADPTVGGAARTDAGAVFVVYGTDATSYQDLALATLDATQGYRLVGAAAGDAAGHAVANIGDINGDGVGDMLIGAPGTDPGGRSDAGTAYVLFGKAGGPGLESLGDVDGLAGFALDGAAAGDGAGHAVARAGDINGDKIPDYIVGAPYADVTAAGGGTLADAGATYVVFGTRPSKAGFPARIDLSTLDGSNGFRIDGKEAGAQSGFSVAAAGDVNGDRIPDILIGAPQAGTGTSDKPGAAYVVFGRAGGWDASMSLADLDGANGFAIEGGTVYGEAGFSVAGIGDIDGDTVDDIAVGARYADVAGLDDGAAYVIYGRADITEQTDTATVTVTVEGESLPPSLSVVDPIGSLEENAPEAERRRIAEIAVTDRDGGDNRLYVDEATAERFEIEEGVLYLKPGVAFDHEREDRVTVYVYSDDPAIGTGHETYVGVAFGVTDVDEPPSVQLSSATGSFYESSDTTAPSYLASIYVTDDALGSATLALTGPDADLFEIESLPANGVIYLYLKADAEIDFEAQESHEVTVTVDDPAIGSGPEDRASFTLSILDANEPPTGASWTETMADLPEDADFSKPIVVGRFAVEDDALGTETVTVEGAASAWFSVVNQRLLFQPPAGAIPDYEDPDARVFPVTVRIDDFQTGESPDATLDLTVRLTDVDEPATLTVDQSLTRIDEDRSTETRIPVATLTAVNDALGSPAPVILGGRHAGRFQIREDTLYLKAGATLDHERADRLEVRVGLTEGGARKAPVEDSATLSLAVRDRNDAPTVTVTRVETRLPETEDTGASRIVVGRVEIADEDTRPKFRDGTIDFVPGKRDGDVLSLTKGGLIVIDKGAALDHETNPELTADILVVDTRLGPSGEASGSLRVRITDVDESTLFTNGDDRQDGTPGADTLKGQRGDDTIDGLRGGDVLRGQAGDDAVRGGAGKDKVLGNTGDDALFGDGGRDKLKGAKGEDSLDGGRGNDVLFGGSQDDLLAGGAGRDRLSGDAGDDRLVPGDGNDTLRGGPGRDVFVFDMDDGVNWILDFDEEEDDLVLPEGLTEKDVNSAQYKEGGEKIGERMVFGDTEIYLPGVDIEDTDYL